MIYIKIIRIKKIDFVEMERITNINKKELYDLMDKICVKNSPSCRGVNFDVIKEIEGLKRVFTFIPKQLEIKEQPKGRPKREPQKQQKRQEPKQNTDMIADILMQLVSEISNMSKRLEKNRVNIRERINDKNNHNQNDAST